MPDTQERRRFPRYDVGKLPGLLDGYRLFETLKISAGGALIRLPAELALEQRVQVSLDLAHISFRTPAEVVFVGPDFSHEGVYRVGLSFADTPEDDLQRLRGYIEQSLAGGARR